MTITKEENIYNTYDITLEYESKKLSIKHEANGDIYMSITEGRRLDKIFNDCIVFDVYKEDSTVYNALDNLYNGIMQKNKEYKSDIIDEYNNIVWVSDEGRKLDEDSLTVIKHKDKYRLLFLRNNENDQYDTRCKRSRSIDIRFATSGSRYNGYTSYIMTMYQELQNIEKEKVYKVIKWRNYLNN